VKPFSFIRKAITIDGDKLNPELQEIRVIFLFLFASFINSKMGKKYLRILTPNGSSNNSFKPKSKYYIFLNFYEFYID